MRTAILLALLAAPASASANDFSDAFPAFPCMDGWMACLVGGATQDPELRADASGHLNPSDARVSYWDLQPTAAFSPFSGLSVYGQVKAQAPEPAAADDNDAVAVVDAATADDEPVARVVDEPVVRKEPPPLGHADPVAKVEPKEPPKDVKVEPLKADLAKDPIAKIEPAKDPIAKVEPAKDPGDSALSKVRPTTDDDKGSALITVAPPETCEELVKLEPAAMLGKLTAGHVTCLESKFTAAEKLTDKDKISRILMSNAWSKGDKATWEKLVKRHLLEVDQSDPDIAYKYADTLGKRGQSTDAIHWAEVALENRTVWTGDTYTKRTAALYKIRAGASQQMWKKAEEAHAASPSDATQKTADTWRAKTKTAAREWYEYLKVSGQDSTIALQLCVAAAGTESYCAL